MVDSGFRGRHEKVRLVGGNKVDLCGELNEVDYCGEYNNDNRISILEDSLRCSMLTFPWKH